MSLKSIEFFLNLNPLKSEETFLKPVMVLFRIFWTHAQFKVNFLSVQSVSVLLSCRLYALGSAPKYGLCNSDLLLLELKIPVRPSLVVG